MQDQRGKLNTKPFDFKARKSRSVLLQYHGRAVNTRIGQAVTGLLAKSRLLGEGDFPPRLARETALFKFGNKKARDDLARR